MMNARMKSDFIASFLCSGRNGMTNSARFGHFGLDTSGRSDHTPSLSAPSSIKRQIVNTEQKRVIAPK